MKSYSTAQASQGRGTLLRQYGSKLLKTWTVLDLHATISMQR